MWSGISSLIVKGIVGGLAVGIYNHQLNISVECRPRWHYANNGAEKFSKKHTIKAFDSSNQITKLTDVLNWSGTEWKFQIKELLRAGDPDTEEEGLKVSQNFATPNDHAKISIILEEYEKFQLEYEKQDPRKNLNLISNLANDLAVNSKLAARHEDTISWYPKRVSVMTANLIDKDDYDVHILQNQFVLIGYLKSKSELKPIHYEGSLLAKETQLEITTLIMDPELQQRFRWSQNVNKMLFWNSVIKHPSIPNKGSNPPPPQRLLTVPLWMTNKNSAGNTEDMHRFQWRNTIAGLNVQPLDIYTYGDQMKDFSYDEFATKAFNLLGKQDYGTVKVHHVILNTMANITASIIQNADEYLSTDHKDCIWLKEKQEIATFLWDNSLDQYRVYIYDGYVLLKCKKAAQRFSAPKPTEIMFIHYTKKPLKIQGNDAYVNSIVLNFDVEFERIRKTTYYKC